MVPFRKNLVSSSKYGIKCPYAMQPTRIVVHNTGGDAPAANEIAYMIGNDNEVSYHYAIDDKEIVQGIPENRNTWNAGDGSGPGNREGLSIEICYSVSGGERFDKAERNAAEFIAYLLKQYKWGIEKVTKHQDYNGKYCPHRTLDKGWQRFLDMVKSFMKDSEELTVAQYDELKKENQALKAKVDALTKTIEDNYRWIQDTLKNMRGEYQQKRFNTLADVPEHWKKETEALVKLGAILGDGKTQLGGITAAELKAAIIAYRADNAEKADK